MRTRTRGQGTPPQRPVLPLGVSVEVHTYRLEVRGTVAGRHVMRQQEEQHEVRMEAEMDLEPPLGPCNVVQLSRSAREENESIEFAEHQEDRQGHHAFRVDFDRGRGQVLMRRDQQDQAAVPFLLPFRDPLSMLRELRRVSPETDQVRIPMLGKSVVARTLGEVDLDTALGPRRARSYLLQPGGSRVWIDTKPPHAILRLSQAMPDHLLEARIVTIGHDTRMPAWERFGGDGDRKSSRKRRRRRRRGRGGRRGRRGD